MSTPSYFISCDWGTSNFRLRLVDTGSLQVLSEVKTDIGIKKRFQEFKAQHRSEQDLFFASYLKEQIGKLDLVKHQDNIVVASGMLSSSIGMIELPYATMPITFTGAELKSKLIQLDEKLKMILVSGVRTDADVMRGEEVQAVGISDQLGQHSRGILILPGTHSKHIYFADRRFEGFTTYMTGELFEILSKNSILATSLHQAEWDSSFQEVFLEGVKKGIANQQMASLFSIRANSLIHNRSQFQNFYFLSGLLIGAELADLKEKSETVYLAATGANNELYKLALESFLPKKRFVCFESELLENALLNGQRKILETYA